MVVTLVGLYGVYRLFRYLHARDRRNGPVWVSFESARKHYALIYLIRTGEAFLVVPVLFVILAIGFLLTLNPLRDTANHSAAFSIVMLSAILFVSVVGIARFWHRMSNSNRDVLWRFKDVNTNSISNFSAIFAAFASHDYYRLMLPATSASRNGLGDRDLMWIFVFMALWTGMKFILNRLLEINSSSSSQNPPVDPDIPEFPQKSPLVQL